MNYTARQLRLYYREALAIDAAHLADSIVAANAGFNGGRQTQRLLRQLRER